MLSGKSKLISSCEVDRFSNILDFICRFNRRFSVSSSPLKMRFVQFRDLKGGPQRLGVQLSQEGDVIDVSAVDSSIPNNLVQFLENGPSLIDKAKR